MASFDPGIGRYILVANRLHSLLLVPFHKLLKVYATIVSRMAFLQAGCRTRADHDPIKKGQELRSKYELLKTNTVVLLLELQDVKLVIVLMLMLFSVVDYIGWHFKRTENVDFEN